MIPSTPEEKRQFELAFSAGAAANIFTAALFFVGFIIIRELQRGA